MVASSGSSDAQNKLWSPIAEDRSRWIGRHLGPMWGAMLDATRVTRGTTLLDAGCGSGEAAAMAVARGASVCGLDASEAMIAVAREAVPGATFVQGDLEALPYSNGQFDAAIASNSVHFAERPAQAVRELARVLRPGGRVAITSMGERADLDARRVVFEPTFALLSGPPPANPFALSDPGVLEALVAGAGLRVVTNMKVHGELHLASFDEAWALWRSIGPIAATANQVGPDRVRDAIRDAAVAAGVLRPAGNVVLRDWFHVVVGEVS
jgi:SAM-dependent methyltransferase